MKKILVVINVNTKDVIDSMDLDSVDFVDRYKKLFGFTIDPDNIPYNISGSKFHIRQDGMEGHVVTIDTPKDTTSLIIPDEQVDRYVSIMEDELKNIEAGNSFFYKDINVNIVSARNIYFDMKRKMKHLNNKDFLAQVDDVSKARYISTILSIQKALYKKGESYGYLCVQSLIEDVLNLNSRHFISCVFDRTTNNENNVAYIVTSSYFRSIDGLKMDISYGDYRLFMLRLSWFLSELRVRVDIPKELRLD